MQIFVAKPREFILTYRKNVANSSAGSTRGHSCSRRNCRVDRSLELIHLKDVNLIEINLRRPFTYKISSSTTSSLSGRCKYNSVVVERLQTEWACGSSFAETRAGFVILNFSNKLFEMFKRFLNAREALSQTTRIFSLAQRYQYFGFLLYSHCTWFSPKKTLTF